MLRSRTYSDITSAASNVGNLAARARNGCCRIPLTWSGMANRVSNEVLRLAVSYPKPFICISCLSRLRPGPISSSRAPHAPHRLLQTEAHSSEEVPLRQKLKAEAEQRRLDGISKSPKPAKTDDSKLDKWELTIGIEIHAELNTERKLFSSAVTSLNEAPNTHVSVFDLALPGTQPQFQKETLLPALRAAIALNCNIQERSSFDRKHYFYQDQPNGYQITQYYEPFARDGHITLYSHDGIDPADGESITIGIKQIQMEQDTAKTIHQPPDTYLLDFNRVSHPLIEIITLPQIHYPATAAALVRKVQSILRAVDANTTGMEMGGLRADVNVSVRQRHSGSPSEAATATNVHSYYGISGLGQRTEIKNLSSFKAVEDAIVAESRRQIAVLEAGGVVEGETRGWTLGSTETKKLRGKEGEVDYRYMPDPDLGPVVIGQDLLEHLRATLPMLPDDSTKMLTEDVSFGLTMKDAKTLVALDDGDRLEYFLDVRDMLMKSTQEEGADVSNHKISKSAANWILHELPALDSAAFTRIAPATLAAILYPLLQARITTRTAKTLLALAHAGTDPRPITTIIAADGLEIQPVGVAEYRALAEEAVRANEDMAAKVRDEAARGREKGKVMWFVGRMVRMAEEEGRVLQPVEAERAVRVVLFGENEGNS